MLLARSVSTPLLVHPFEKREILCAFHDIDGTHSLIRDWPPVMSIVLATVIQEGLPENFDDEAHCARLIAKAGERPLPETDRFCVESAGLSALTQMEWAIRRALDNGSIQARCDKALNAKKIQLIWQGQEIFDDMPETPEMQALLSQSTPRLFRFYERVLNGFCRDRNLAKARECPAAFQVPGSMAFMRFLRQGGVRNFFVTGAVVERGMGMFEEVETLGYALGSNGVAEDIIGSTWTEKLPKEQIMGKLLSRLGMDGRNILVVGDGRAEIAAGVAMGAVTLSRLPESAEYQRQLHRKLGTHLIVSDYLSPYLKEHFTQGRSL